jgi:hypothetical protein
MAGPITNPGRGTTTGDHQPCGSNHESGPRHQLLGSNHESSPEPPIPRLQSRILAPASCSVALIRAQQQRRHPGLAALRCGSPPALRPGGPASRRTTGSFVLQSPLRRMRWTSGELAGGPPRRRPAAPGMRGTIPPRLGLRRTDPRIQAEPQGPRISAAGPRREGRALPHKACHAIPPHLSGGSVGKPTRPACVGKPSPRLMHVYAFVCIRLESASRVCMSPWQRVCRSAWQ